MRILTTGMGWIHHAPGGLNRYFAEYTAAMTRYGHEIRACVTTGGDRTELPAYIDNVAAPDSGTWSRMRAFRRTVGTAVDDRRPEVFNPHFALYASLIGRDQVPADIPIVTHFHGPWAQESLVEDRGPAIARLVRYRMKKAIEKAAYRRSDRFIVLSRYFQSVLEQDYGISPDRIHRIPGAVDEAVFRPADNREQLRRELGIREGTRVLLCVRRLAKRMGIDRLIRAMTEIAGQCPEAVLFIAGDGAQRSDLELLARDLRLSGKVRFLGRVDHEALVKWYQAADLSLVPTVSLEGFGLVTVESLACGTPVMGTAHGGTKEILTPLAPDMLFDENTPKAMARGVLSYLRGEADIPGREHCRDYVLRHYTWQHVAQAATELFEQAVQDGRQRRAAR